MSTVTINGVETSLEGILKSRGKYLSKLTVKIIVLAAITFILFLKAINTDRVPSEILFIYGIMFGGILLLITVLIKKTLTSKELLNVNKVITHGQYVTNNNGLIVKEIIDGELYDVSILQLDRVYLITGDRVLVYPNRKG